MAWSRLVPSRFRAAAATAMLLMVVAAPGATIAQQRMNVHGWVQWISGTRMQVTTDDGLSLAVDLNRIDQRAYQSLKNGDGITVAGVVASDRSRLMAERIWPDSGLRGPAEAP